MTGPLGDDVDGIGGKRDELRLQRLTLDPHPLTRLLGEARDGSRWQTRLERKDQAEHSLDRRGGCARELQRFAYPCIMPADTGIVVPVASLAYIAATSRRSPIF